MVTNGYTTVALVKAEVGITDSADDTRLDRIVTAVSRQIDDYLGAHVYGVSAIPVNGRSCASAFAGHG